MNFVKYSAEHSGNLFIIEDYGPDVGCNLFIFDNEQGHGKCIRDYFEPNLDITKRFALEDFGVPLDAWINVGLIQSKKG